VHAHHADAAALVEHLQAYHDGDRRALEAGWHLHMFFPDHPLSSESDGEPPVGYPPLAMDSLASGMIAAGIGSCASCEWITFQLTPFAGPSPLFDVAIAGRHPPQVAAHCFLTTLLSALPLRAVTGVARC
jgi:hypothetical protein